MKEKGENEEETDVKMKKLLKRMELSKQEQERSTEKYHSPSLFLEEKEDPDKIDETKEI